jgi:hypothetical protein
MPKKTETADKPKADDQTSSVAINKGEYDTLVGKVANANTAMDNARTRKSELIADAVSGKNLHKGAFAWVMKLRKMDPVKRNEYLFHFDVMCGYEKFAREDLLDDRKAPADEGDDIPDPPDDQEDLRPRHLRQPGASVTSSAVDKIKEDALSKVGRGKPTDGKLN